MASSTTTPHHHHHSHPHPLASSPTTSSAQHAHFFAQPGTITQDEKTSPNSTTVQANIRVPDGRRNSYGEILPSPIESWRPDIKRKQSWKQEDLKRNVYGQEMKEGEVGQGTGFTEGGEGTRRV